MSGNRAFGEQLRYWRRARGNTQLDLSITAGYSQRHLSFLESGRSQPSRETVIVLADCLEVPVCDRNQLLQAAGFAPIYTEESIDSGRLEVARRAVEEVLRSHRPFPALLVDRAWNTYSANASAQALFSTFVHEPEQYPQDLRMNAVRLCIEDSGMKPYIENLGGFLTSVLGQLKVEIQRAVVHEELSALADEIHSVLRQVRPRVESAQEDLPIGCLRLRRGDVSLALFTMMSTFNFPLDATLEELRIETFFPADQETRSYLIALDESIEEAAEVRV